MTTLLRTPGGNPAIEDEEIGAAARIASVSGRGNYAPIALFVYNRPWHTRQTVEALRRNALAEDSHLFVFSDAARNASASEAVREVREHLKRMAGFKSVSILEREKNLGLANSIIDGITRLCEKFGRVIVLEDDLVTSPHFLRYMNAALDQYADQPMVYSISGYSFTNDIRDIDSSYFLALTSSWGWATWADKWKTFTRNRDALAERLKASDFRQRFNYENSFDYSALAESQLEGKTDSWAIYWYFCVFQNNGLTLYPGKSLVQNIGFDGTGIHCGEGVNDASLTSFVPRLTNDIYEKSNISAIVQTVLREKRHPASLRRLIGGLKNRITRQLPNRTRVRIDQFAEAVKLLFHRKDIGRDTFVDKTVQVLGWHSISIGSSSAIGEHTWLNVNNRESGQKHIVIGNNCWIGRRNLFSSGQLILVSDYCMTGIGCRFLGADHLFSNPLSPYIATGMTNDKTIRLGVNVWLGAGVTIVGNVSIGHGSVIGVNALVNKDIPPFSIAFGNPCKVHKKYDFVLRQWVKLSEYCPEHDSAMPGETAYLAMLIRSHPKIAMPLQASSRKFGNML